MHLRHLDRVIAIHGAAAALFLSSGACPQPCASLLLPFAFPGVDVDFAPPAFFEPGHGVVVLDAADLDGDGDVDVAVAASVEALSILLNDGSGTLAVSQSLVLADGGLHLDMLACDLDGDGDADLAIAAFGNGSVSVVRNDGAGGFGAATVHDAEDVSATRGMAAADFDADGDLDLLVGDAFSTAKAVLLNDGAGGFDAGIGFATGGSTICAAAGDLDGDGAPDAVTTFSDGTWLHPGAGDGTFGPAVLLGPDHAAAVTLGDLNGDGDLDVVAAGSNVASGGHVNVFIHAQAGFIESTFPTATLVRDVDLADLDQDGDLDVVTAHVADVNEVSVLLNDGAGALSPPVGFFPGIYPQSVALADLDADGAIDVVSANQFADPPNVGVLVNETSTGTASVAVRNGSGVNPLAYATGDLPVLGTAFTATVDTTVVDGAKGSVILVAAGSLAGAPTGVGELLVAPPILLITPLVLPSPEGLGTHVLLVPVDPVLEGLTVPTQAAILGGTVQLTNALDLTLGT